MTETGEGKLQTNGKKKKDHPDFGNDLDRFGIMGEGKSFGPTNAPDSTNPAMTGNFNLPKISVTNTLMVAIKVISSSRCI